MEEVPESVREMIMPSVQALAELTARIKMLELEINTLAQMKYPQSAQLQQIPGGSDRSRPSILSSRLRIQIVLHTCATSEPTPAYVHGAIKAARATRSCVSPSAATLTCAGCSLAPRTTSSVPSARKVPCDNQMATFHPFAVTWI